jgi:hypothetical protein
VLGAPGLEIYIVEGSFVFVVVRGRRGCEQQLELFAATDHHRDAAAGRIGDLCGGESGPNFDD